MTYKEKYPNTKKYENGYKTGATMGKSDYYMPPNEESEEYDGYNKEFYLKYAEFIWSMYANNETGISFDHRTSSGKSFYELRKYAQGKQDREKYKDLLDECTDPNKNEGYMNINWDNVKLMTKFKDLVMGKMMGIDFDVMTQAVDEISTKKRTHQYTAMKTMAEPAIREMMQLTGFRPQGVTLPDFIEKPEDVDLYNKMGGIRLTHEIFMRDAIEISKYESSWDTIADRLRSDIIDVNIAATRTYMESATGKVLHRHVLPENLIIESSAYNDHRDSSYAGEIITMSISQLRRECDMTEEEVECIAKLYKSNKSLDNYDYDNLNSDYSGVYKQPTSQHKTRTTNSVDSLKIYVLDFAFIAKEVERYIIGMAEDNKELYEKVSNKASLKGRDKKSKKIEDYTIEYVFTGKWIIGSEFVFDCKKETATVRQGKNGVKKSILPFTVYSDNRPSLVERCIPYIDEIQLAVLKQRNTVAKLPPGPRIAIDISKIEDTLTFGKESFSMMELLNIFPKTGVFLYRSTAEYEEYAYNQRAPIEPIASGIQEDLAILRDLVLDNIQHIRNETGINEVADGTSQQRDMLVQVMEGLNAATNNALKPHYRIYQMLYFNQCKYTVLKWQVALLGGDIDGEYVPMGDTVIKKVKLSKDLYDYDFGIHLVMMPTEEDKQLLLQDLLSKNANGMIAPESYFMIYNMIRNGDIKKAQFFFAKASRDFMVEQHQREMEKIQAQAQSNAQSAQAAEAAKAQNIQLEAQLKMQLISHEEEEKRKTMTLQAQLKLGEKDKDLENNVVTKMTDTMMDATKESAMDGNF